MGKAKRAAKRERKRDKGQEEESRLAERRAGRIRAALLAGVPLIALGLAAVAYWVWESPSLTGATLLLGALLWLMVGLGQIGARVTPRDRQRAGSIDFGQRK